MADIQDLEKNMAIVHCLNYVDVAGVAKTGDYIHMKNYDGVTFVVSSATVTNECVVTLQQCTQDADAGADAKQIGDGKSVTFTVAASDDNATKTITVAAPELDIDGGFEWLELSTDTAAAAVLGATAICYRARYAEATMPSPLT